MFQQPQARYGNITNQRFEGAKQQNDLTSLSSMASSSSVSSSSSSVSSVTQQNNNKSRQFDRQAKSGEALKSGQPNASSQVALNETYVNYIESLKASNKTRSPNDTVLTHPSAYSVFSATSVETQPAARSQYGIVLFKGLGAGKTGLELWLKTSKNWQFHVILPLNLPSCCKFSLQVNLSLGKF